MADVFDVLARDHREIRAMLDELADGADGADESRLVLRTRMTEQLIIADSRHESAEEMYFWPAVRKHLIDGDVLADRGVAQEQEAKRVLARLDQMEAGHAGFDILLRAVTAAARAHIDFEERQVWPSLRSAVTELEAEELGGLLSIAENAAPTRPHPNTPGTPGVQKAVGPAAGLVDKARDAITGRDE